MSNLTFNRGGIVKNLAQNDLTINAKLNILKPNIITVTDKKKKKDNWKAKFFYWYNFVWKIYQILWKENIMILLIHEQIFFYTIDLSDIVGLLLNVLANQPLPDVEKEYLEKHLRDKSVIFDDNDVKKIIFNK